jgi:hypothetical protein
MAAWVDLQVRPVFVYSAERLRASHPAADQHLRAASACAKKVAECCCTRRYSVVCLGRCRSQWTGPPSGARRGCRSMACTRGSQGCGLGRSQVPHRISIALWATYLWVPTSEWTPIGDNFRDRGDEMPRSCPSPAAANGRQRQLAAFPVSCRSTRGPLPANVGCRRSRRTGTVGQNRPLVICSEFPRLARLARLG